MRLYHYHPATGNFTGSSLARHDPREYDNALSAAIAASPDARSVSVSVDKWLIPANATDVPPPATIPDGHTAQFSNGRWRTIPNPAGASEESVGEALPESLRLVSGARSALADSDHDALAFYDHQRSVPKKLVAYRDALRAIIKANGEGVTELPTKPEV